MRIVGGKHRGRRLAAPTGRDTRPTADRTRQALFNILEHRHFVPGGGSPVRGARVVDAFAGTGAMGLEALSRGAAHASFLERDPRALAVLRYNVESCGEAPNATVLQADATRPPAATAPCTIAFLDPPYDSGLAGPCLEALAARGWLAEGALCVVEVGADENFAPPERFEPLDERKYGAARIMLLGWGRNGGAVNGREAQP